jgi:hypothetical protein
VWHNCLLFNPASDPVTVACCEVRQRFNELWRDAQLPLTPAPPAPVQPPSAAAPRADKKRKAAARPVEPLPSESSDDASEDDASDSGGPPANSARCAVCQVQRKGKCGTPTAPARCQRRTAGMAVVAPPRREPGAQPARASARTQPAYEPPPPPMSAAAIAAAAAARVQAHSELAAAHAVLQQAQAQLSVALVAEGAARDAVRGMRPHDAPEPQRAPPGWAPEPARLTHAAHALASFWWGLPRRITPRADTA